MSRLERYWREEGFKKQIKLLNIDWNSETLENYM